MDCLYFQNIYTMCIVLDKVNEDGCPDEGNRYRHEGDRYIKKGIGIGMNWMGIGMKGLV